MLQRLFARLVQPQLRTTTPSPAHGAPPPRPVVTSWQPRSARPYPYGLDTPLLSFTPHNAYTIRMAAEGTVILGDMGSGKSSGSGAAIAHAMLRAGMGGLVLCKKKDEAATWLAYAKRTGRSNSILHVRHDRDWRFNLLDYQLTRSGEGAGYTENAVNMFMHIVENRKKEGNNSERAQRFFLDGARRLLRHLIEALLVADEPVTMPHLMKALRSLPRPSETGAQWRTPSYLFDCLLDAERRQTLGQQLPSDPTMIREYFEYEFATTGSDRQSAGIISTLTGMIDPFTSGPMLTLFGSETNFLPEFSREGAVILLDLPLDEWEEMGHMAAIAFKYVWQRAMLRRQGLPPGEVPVFAFIDEHSQFVTADDRSFQEAARSSVACGVYLTQNINNYIAAFGGGPEGEANAYGLLAGTGTKIFHRNGDFKTNEFAANTIAKSHTVRQTGGLSRSKNATQGTSDSDSAGRGGYGRSQGDHWADTESTSSGRSENLGWREEMDYQVQPEAFTRLKSGGPRHGGKVEAIVFRSGERFSTTGRPYTGTTFRQGG